MHTLPQPFQKVKPSLPPPPSRPGESQRLLEEQITSQICLLDHDHAPRTIKAALDAGLTSEHFQDERHGQLFRALCLQLDSTGTIDPFTAIMDLHESGAIEEAEVSTLAELSRRDASPLTIKENVGKLRQWNAKRKATHHARRAGLYLEEGDTLRAADEMQLARDELEQVEISDPIFHKLQSRKFDPENLTEPREPILTIKGRPIISRGNLLTLKAPDKAGKSHLLGAMARAATEGGRHLGIESPGGGKVAYIDCEQDREDFEKLILHQAGAAQDVLAYHLTGFTPGQSLDALRVILRNEKELSMLLIDGYADLLQDVNDPEQSNALVGELMALAEKYQIAIAGVLHLNPNSESKSRGHLGSQLGRKSQTTLQIKIDDDTRILFTPPGGARKRPLPASEGVRFEWSDDAHGFVEIEGTPGEVKQAARVEEWTRLLREIEATTEMKAWSYTDLFNAIAKVEGVKTRTAKARISHWLDAGLVQHGASTGFYTSTLD